MLHVYSAAGNIIGILKTTKTLPSSLPVPLSLLDKHHIDQLILYHPLSLQIKIFNRDGSVAKNCGNGLRALGHHLYKHSPSPSDLCHIQLNNQTYWLHNKSHGPTVETWVQVGQPIIKCSTSLEQGITPYTLMSVGNDHLVVWNYPICIKLISAYCQQFNVSFAYTLPDIPSKPNTPFPIYLQTYERGVGWTQSCGSAAACMTALAQHYFPNTLNLKWEINTPGGVLKTQMTPEGIIQTGAVNTISEIQISDHWQNH